MLMWLFRGLEDEAPKSLVVDAAQRAWVAGMRTANRRRLQQNYPLRRIKRQKLVADEQRHR
jgi:hypothetical protein